MRFPVRRAIALWLPSAAAATVLAGLAYGAVQQDYRQSANDPQIQMAEDAARALGGGAQASQVAFGARVDLAASLAPYLVVYGPDGSPVAGTGTLDGRLPRPPEGVLATARDAGQDVLTWEPRDGVRQAIVVKPYGSQGGTVLTGRSLRAIEQREDRLFLIGGAGWATAVAAAAVGAVLGVVLLDRRPATPAVPD